MSVAVQLEELLDYSDHERRKWREWLIADPARLAIRMQPDGRFPTVQAMFDHVFLVERRHLCRLEGSTPPESTGIPPGDIAALFEYADLVRTEFRSYLGQLGPAEAAATMTVSSPALGHYTVQRWKLATHIVLHEVRHFAQLTLAARVAGQAPPGEHDFFFYPGAAVRQA